MSSIRPEADELGHLAHVGRWTWDPNAGSFEWSDELYVIHGVDHRGFDKTLDGFLALVREDHRAEVRAALELAAQGQGALEAEYPIVKPSGEERWVFLRGEPDANGLRGICQDVTDRKRAERALERHAMLVGLLTAVAVAANEAGTLEGALRRCVREVCAHTGWPVGHVYLASLIGADLVSSGLWHVEGTEDYTAFRRATEAGPVARGQGLAGQVLETAKPAWAEDLAADPDSERALAAVGVGLRAAFAFPVLVGREVVAVLEFFSTAVEHPDEQLLGVMAGCGTQVGRVVERARAAEALTNQALHDPLTRLPNRSLFLDRLEQAVSRLARTGGAVAVLFLDLDGFKDINDSLGHDVGDNVLVAVSERLRAVLRPTDSVARFGGDEFTVLCESFGTVADVLEVADRVAQAVSEPLDLAPRGRTVVTASIGIAFAREAVRAESLLRDADAAMYRAKEKGRARYEVFDATMLQQATRRLELTNALRRAVDEGEFRLVYQPQVALPEGRIVGAEALVRWAHPERGLIAPGEFISVAEESQIIVGIGAWVLEEACRQVACWQQSSLLAAGFKICVNVSARQLDGADLADLIARVLADSGLDPPSLCVEITETVIMGEADFYLEALLGLKALGVTLAIDDFGVGYSSLAYLRRFPIDVLKIDKSFVDGLGGGDPEDSAIVGAVVAMAHALELTAVAEGVESAEQAGALERLGCDAAQGYWFAKPQPPDAVADLLLRGTLP